MRTLKYVWTRLGTSLKNITNRPYIMIHDKKQKEIVLIEVGITSNDRLQAAEIEKKQKYNVLANGLGANYGLPPKIIPDDNNTGL